MKVKMFAIWDDKAKAYLNPFCFPQTGQAIRVFTGAVNDKNTEFFKHAEDYTLFHIGDFDDATGQLTAATHVELVVSAQQVKETVK